MQSQTCKHCSHYYVSSFHVGFRQQLRSLESHSRILLQTFEGHTTGSNTCRLCHLWVVLREAHASAARSGRRFRVCLGCSKACCLRLLGGFYLGLLHTLLCRILCSRKSVFKLASCGRRCRLC